MSDEEKNLLIGAAASAFQAARVELAYIDEKLNRVRMAYFSAANAIGSNGGRHLEIQVIGGVLKFGVGSSLPPPSPADLLDAASLVVLVESRDKARAELESARVKLHGLGMTNLA